MSGLWGSCMIIFTLLLAGFHLILDCGLLMVYGIWNSSQQLVISIQKQHHLTAFHFQKMH